MRICPRCKASDRQWKIGVTAAGSQRYQCGGCDTRPKPIGYPEALRQQAVKLYLDGMNYRRIGRQLGVDHGR